MRRTKFAVARLKIVISSLFSDAKFGTTFLKIKIERKLCYLQLGAVCAVYQEVINKQKTKKTMLIHIPFDHIKVLDDGNYGCTLKMGKKLYCAVCTPYWNWVEPLHEVEQDPYQDYTYIRDRSYLVPSSYYFNKEIYYIDSELIDLLNLKTEIMLNNISIDIEDYISETSASTDEDYTVSLFTIHYLEADANFVLICQMCTLNSAPQHTKFRIFFNSSNNPKIKVKIFN